jgi:hypothetical protein
MSRISIIAAIVLLPVAVFSQVQKGDNFGTADGSFYYNHSAFHSDGNLESKGYDLYYTLNWGMLHFVSKRIAIGPGFGFAVSNGQTHYQNSNPYSKGTSSSVSVDWTLLSDTISATVQKSTGSLVLKVFSIIPGINTLIPVQAITVKSK